MDVGRQLRLFSESIVSGAMHGAAPEVKVDVGLGHKGEGDATNEGEVIQDRRQADAHDGADLYLPHAHRHHRRHVNRWQHFQLTCAEQESRPD